LRIKSIKKRNTKYTPATRALTGAIVEKAFSENEAESIYITLNPATIYDFSISVATLPNKQKCFIK
jgi:hypothetical protein